MSSLEELEQRVAALEDKVDTLVDAIGQLATLVCGAEFMEKIEKVAEHEEAVEEG